MFLIKSCPSCQHKLRFPIDKGKINVKCQCGYSFIADPDSKALYKDAKFDLSQGNKKKKKSTNSRQSLISILINSLLDFKYNIQNFKLLPSNKQMKIVFFLFTIILLIIFIVVLTKNMFFSASTQINNFM